MVIKVGDKITTDHIMPAGVHLKLRSNIPAYSKVVFECFTEPGRPSFAERAAAVRDSGKAGVIVGRDSYGQGSSREHAAICPMYLGGKVVDYDAIDEKDELRFTDLHKQLAVGAPVRAELVKENGQTQEIIFKHRLSDEDIRIILAGGMLNLK